MALLRAAARLAQLGAEGIAGSTRSISTIKLPDMPYSYSALEPVISGQVRGVCQAKH